MSTHLNRRPDYDWDYKAAPEVEQTPKYQAFNDLNSHTTRLEELIFFGQLAFFCVATVVFSFLLLALGLPSFLALPLGIAISAGATYVGKELLL